MNLQTTELKKRDKNQNNLPILKSQNPIKKNTWWKYKTMNQAKDPLNWLQT